MFQEGGKFGLTMLQEGPKLLQGAISSSIASLIKEELTDERAGF